MSKDPAFLFYPGDWLGGTLGMSFEEKGAYMEILMLQFNRGHMTTHMIRHVIGHHWDTLQVKFIQDDKGLWFNKRLDEEKEKRKNFVSSRKNNIKGENQYTKKQAHKSGHMTSHMENENRNKDYNTIKEVSKFIAIAYKKKYTRDEGGEIGQDIDYMSERLLQNMTKEQAMNQIRSHKLYIGLEKLTLPSKIETIQAALLETDWVQRIKENQDEETIQSQITNEQYRNRRNSGTEEIAPAFNGRIDPE